MFQSEHTTRSYMFHQQFKSNLRAFQAFFYAYVNLAHFFLRGVQ
jgi:hypothetical protein